MLRINLLPSYVSQRRITRKLYFIFGLAFILCLIVPTLMWMNASQQKTMWLEKARTAEAGKATTDGLRQQASSTRGQIAPITAKVDYVKAVHQHNQDIVTFWDTVSRYSDGSRMVYSDAVVSGTVLTIKAYSPSIAEVGRYLQAMYQEPDFQSVGIDKIPGYPEAVVDKYYLGNRLIAVGSSTGASGRGGAPGGAPGAPPPGFSRAGGNPGGRGYPGGGGAAATHPAFGTPANLGAGGRGSTVPTIGGGRGGANDSDGVDTQALFQVVAASPQFRNADYNPFASPQSRVDAIMHIVKQIKVRREPQGFPITVTATLKQPLGTPTLPGGAGAGGAGGAGGYPGMGPSMMGPGAYPGPPGGMPPGYPGAPPA